MTYIDQVLKQIQDAKPGTKLNISGVRNPARYIGTVKQLMDEGTLHYNQVEFTSDYRILKILDPDILNFKKHQKNNKRLWKLYQELKALRFARIAKAAAKLEKVRKLERTFRLKPTPARTVKVVVECGKLNL